MNVTMLSKESVLKCIEHFRLKIKPEEISKKIETIKPLDKEQVNSINKLFHKPVRTVIEESTLLVKCMKTMHSIKSVDDNLTSYVDLVFNLIDLSLFEGNLQRLSPPEYMAYKYEEELGRVLKSNSQIVNDFIVMTHRITGLFGTESFEDDFSGMEDSEIDEFKNI